MRQARIPTEPIQSSANTGELGAGSVSTTLYELVTIYVQRPPLFSTLLIACIEHSHLVETLNECINRAVQSTQSTMLSARTLYAEKYRIVSAYICVHHLRLSTKFAKSIQRFSHTVCVLYQH